MPGRIKKFYKIPLLFALLLVLSACAIQPTVRPTRRPPDPANPIRTIAVLPVYNISNDVEGPEMIRREIEARVQGMHYDSMPLADVDRILRDGFGITLGAQLQMATPKELGEALGVDGLIYGYLLDFDDITTGIYNSRRVRAGFRLINAKTGEAVWSRGQGVKSEILGKKEGAGIAIAKDILDSTKEELPIVEDIRSIPGIGDWRVLSVIYQDTIEQAAVLTLGTKIFGKAFGVHLLPESQAAADHIMKDFPIGPGRHFIFKPVEKDKKK